MRHRSSTDAVLRLLETRGFTALRVSPVDSWGIFFESIIKLADVGMNLQCVCVCTAEPSLQSEFLKLYCWGGIEGGAAILAWKGNTARREKIELYAYKKVRMRKRIDWHEQVNFLGLSHWWEPWALRELDTALGRSEDKRLYFLWR